MTPNKPTIKVPIITHTFPLRPGEYGNANLYLPANLTKKEAIRLARFIEALAFPSPKSEIKCDRVFDGGGAYTARVTDGIAYCPSCNEPTRNHKSGSEGV